MKISFDDLNPFDRAFFTAAFCSLDNNELCTNAPSQLWKKLDAVNKKTMLYTLHNWRIAHEGILSLAGTHEQNGYDLWTHQGSYGAGFWNRGYSVELTAELCKAARELDPLECFLEADSVFIE